MIRSVDSSKLSKNTKKLYVSAFPLEERMEEQELIKLLTTNDHVHLREYYDDDTYLGFFVYTLVDSFCYIGYFAINKSLRLKGYGSKVIQNFKKEFANYTIVFGIEEVVDFKDLKDLKTKRFLFYKKNGFIFNDFNVKSKFGGIFNVVSTKKINKNILNKFIKKWVPGIFVIIKKTKYH